MSGCYNISNLQNASLLPKREFDVSASYSANSYYDTKYDEHNFLANRLGIQSTYGLYKDLNLRTKYEFIIPEYENVENIHYASLGLKFPIVNKYLAAYLPVSAYYSKDVSPYQNVFIEPALISSIYLNKSITINFALTSQIFGNEIGYVGSLINGVDIKNIFPNFTFMPEWGVAINQHNKGMYYFINVGVSYHGALKGVSL